MTVPRQIFRWFELVGKKTKLERRQSEWRLLCGCACDISPRDNAREQFSGGLTLLLAFLRLMGETPVFNKVSVRDQEERV